MKNIKQPLWYLSYIAVILYFLLIPKLVFAQDSLVLPAWFWKTPEISGVSLAVGYAMPFYNLQSSYEEAFKNAAWRLFTDRKSRISGNKGSMAVPEGLMSIGKTLKMSVDSSYFNAFSASLIRLDSAVTGRLVVMIVGTGMANIDKSLITSPNISEQKRLDEKEFITSQGFAPEYYYETSSWEEAERDARFEAALSILSRIKGISKSLNDLYHNLINIETDVILRDIQTVTRGIDYSTGVRWVRVRVRNWEIPDKNE